MTSQSPPEVVVITGASAGIGRATVRELTTPIHMLNASQELAPVGQSIGTL